MSDHFSAAMLKFPGGDPRLGITLSRRKILGGLAASPVIPVLYSIGSASTALASTVTRSGSVPEASDELVREVERRYNAARHQGVAHPGLLPLRAARIGRDRMGPS